MQNLQTIVLIILIAVSTTTITYANNEEEIDDGLVSLDANNHDTTRLPLVPIGIMVIIGTLKVIENSGYHPHPRVLLPNKVIEDGVFVAGNFGIFPKRGIIPNVKNSFFSTSIGHFSISDYKNVNGTYELQLELEYLQDENTTDNEEINSINALLYNFTGYFSEDSNTSFYISFGVGGGKLDLDFHSLIGTDSGLDENGLVSQFRIGMGSKLTERFRVNLGYRTIIFRGDTDDIISHRIEAGGAYKW